MRWAWQAWVTRVWRPCFVEITPVQIVVAAGVLFVFDRATIAVGSPWYGAFFDEPAHIATALLGLNLLPRRWRDPILPWALPASFLIDADHVPQYAFHDYFLTHGTDRPYGHSLTSIAVCLLIALLWRRGRIPFIGIAVGLALHFLRDLAENADSGVALLWPVSDHNFAYGQNLYLAIMAAVTVANLARVAAEHRRAGPVRSPRALHRADRT
jgi:inner membrane protein